MMIRSLKRGNNGSSVVASIFVIAMRDIVELC